MTTPGKLVFIAAAFLAGQAAAEESGFDCKTVGDLAQSIMVMRQIDPGIDYILAKLKVDTMPDDVSKLATGLAERAYRTPQFFDQGDRNLAAATFGVDAELACARGKADPNP